VLNLDSNHALKAEVDLRLFSAYQLYKDGHVREIAIKEDESGVKTLHGVVLTDKCFFHLGFLSSECVCKVVSINDVGAAKCTCADRSSLLCKHIHACIIHSGHKHAEWNLKLESYRVFDDEGNVESLAPHSVLPLQPQPLPTLDAHEQEKVEITNALVSHIESTIAASNLSLQMKKDLVTEVRDRVIAKLNDRKYKKRPNLSGAHGPSKRYKRTLDNSYVSASGR
jgi:hypothetical protein